MPTDDQNPTRPTPHGRPDRRYVDRDQVIPAEELARKVDEFLSRFAPSKRKRVEGGEPDSFERRMGELPGIIERCPDRLEYARVTGEIEAQKQAEWDEGDEYDRGEQ